MFKLTGRSGRRNAGGGGATQASGRIVSPFNKFRSRDIMDEMHRRPAFLPPTPQEQTMDSDSPRLQGLEKNLSGGNH